MIDCLYKCNYFVPKASLRYTKNVHKHADMIAYISQVHKQHFHVQQQHLKLHKKNQAPRLLFFEALAWTFKKQGL